MPPRAEPGPAGATATSAERPAGPPRRQSFFAAGAASAFGASALGAASGFFSVPSAFGAAVYLILLVPILNTFFLPAAIVGGTLLFRGLRAAGALGPPPPPTPAPRSR